MEIKNTRLLPMGQFEFVDNGVLLTIINVANGQVEEKKVYEELTDALKSYREKCKDFAKLILEMEKKSEKPNEKEDLD